MVDGLDIPMKLQNRFTWESDGKLDSWHVMDDEGPVRGDCEDFATRVLYDLADRSWPRFWWLLVSFQACFWFVRSPKGEPHMVLWVRGYGWTDNYKDEWTVTAAPHTKRYPFIWPWVVLKLLIGKVDKS